MAQGSALLLLLPSLLNPKLKLLLLVTPELKHASCSFRRMAQASAPLLLLLFASKP
jgi:hypothetical protein